MDESERGFLPCAENDNNTVFRSCDNKNFRRNDEMGEEW